MAPRRPRLLDFIYFIEEHPIYLPLVEPLFEAIDAGELEAVTSSLTLLEVLVIPFRFGRTGASGIPRHLGGIEGGSTR